MKNNAQAQKVGIVGVGRMGLAMVKHLVKNDYPVVVCDTKPENVDKAREFGDLVSVAADPAELGRNASYVIVAVGYDAEVKSVILGDNGLLTTLAPNSIIAVSSTIAPDFVKQLAQHASEKQVELLDAPICRGRWFADRGELLALLGGTDEVVAASHPIFSTFCSDIAHLGEIGHGQVSKAINNLLLWINSIGLIEAGRLAESNGIDLPKLRDALMMSSAKSQALNDWEQTSFTWALKDMQIVAGMTDEAELSLPITGAVRELVKEARRVKLSDPPQWTTSS